MVATRELQSANVVGNIYTPTGAGAVARTLRSKIEEPAGSPLDFGAVGDGVANIDAALDAAWAVADMALFPPGIFLIQNLHTVTFGKSIKGAGVGKTILVVDTASFLKIEGGSDFASSEIRDVTILAKQSPTSDNYCIWADGVDLTNRQTLKIRNIEIRSYDGLPVGVYGYKTFIRMSNLLSPEVDNPMIRGTFNTQASGGVGDQNQCCAILLDGQTIDPRITGCKIGGFYTGIKLTDSVEGFFITNNYIVGAYDGIINDTTPPGTQRPGAYILANHVNSVFRGIYITDKIGIYVDNNIIYRSDVFFATDTYVAIGMDSCLRCGINGNEIAIQTDAGTRELIRIEDCQGITGTGNMLAAAAASADVTAIKHVGTNTSVMWANTVIHSVDDGFSLTTGDTDVIIGPHVFIGSVTNKYVVPTQKRSIVIWRRGLSYNSTGTYSYSAAGTETLTAGTSAQFNYYNFGAGGSPYTYTIELDKTGALNGDVFKFKIILPSNTNPTVVIKNGVAGSTLVTLNTASSKRYAIDAICLSNGDWFISSAVEMLAV